MSTTSDRRVVRRRPRRDNFNQEKILRAATAAYRREGPPAPMSDITPPGLVLAWDVVPAFSTRDALLGLPGKRSFELRLSLCRQGVSGGPALVGVAQFLEGVTGLSGDELSARCGGQTRLSAGAGAARSGFIGGCGAIQQTRESGRQLSPLTYD